MAAWMVVAAAAVVAVEDAVVKLCQPLRALCSFRSPTSFWYSVYCTVHKFVQLLKTVSAAFMI